MKEATTMIQIKKVDETNSAQVIETLEADVLRHVFAFYDIQHDKEHTVMHAAFSGNRVEGYILTYTATDVLSVVLECQPEIAGTLLEKAPENHFIMHTAPNLLPEVQKRFPSEKHYLESWMMVKKGEANFFKSNCVRKLQKNSADASLLVGLFSTRKDRPEKEQKKYLAWIGKMPIYGVVLEDGLVAYAGSFIQLPQVWMIGGVYTDPNRRNRGYATLATSAITEEALKNSEAAALFARSDNYSAVRVYEKIGYRKIGEKMWVDVGTGLKP